MEIENIVSKLKVDGFCVIPQYGNLQKLEALKTSLLSTIDHQQKLKSNDANFLVVQDPFYTCPVSLELACDNFIREIAERYLNKPVFLGTCNLRRSKLTTAPPTSTNLFHLDENCGKGVRLIKAFYYLNDVDVHGGPFEYIRGSHVDRMPHWESKIRWTDQEIYSHYGEDRSVKLTANYGDLILADTTGYHRGLQVRSRHRDMLTINYVTQLELERCIIRVADSELHPTLLKESLRR